MFQETHSATYLVGDHPVRSLRSGFAAFFEVASTPLHGSGLRPIGPSLKSFTWLSIQAFNRKVTLSPYVQAPLQRARMGQSHASELQRDQSARRFIGASAVNDNFPIEIQILGLKFDVFRQDVEGSGNTDRIRVPIKAVSHIENQDV